MKTKSPKNIKVEAKNPRYEGATLEMVGKALMQRPKNSDRQADDRTSEDTDSGTAYTTT